MRRKCILVILLIILMKSAFFEGKVEIATCENEELMQVEITNFQWKLIDNPNYLEEGKTKFKFNTSFSFFNPNDEPKVLHYNTLPCQIYATNMSFTFSKSRLTAKFDHSCHGLFCVEGDVVIPTGWVNGCSSSYLYVEKEGLTVPPDGNYLMWMTIFQYGESFLNSTRTMMRIRNGIALFDYAYTQTLNISIPLQIMTPIMLIIYVAYSFSRRNRRASPASF